MLKVFDIYLDELAVFRLAFLEVCTRARNEARAKKAYKKALSGRNASQVVPAETNTKLDDGEDERESLIPLLDHSTSRISGLKKAWDDACLLAGLEAEKSIHQKQGPALLLLTTLCESRTEMWEKLAHIFSKTAAVLEDYTSAQLPPDYVSTLGENSLELLSSEGAAEVSLSGPSQPRFKALSKLPPVVSRLLELWNECLESEFRHTEHLLGWWGSEWEVHTRELSVTHHFRALSVVGASATKASRRIHPSTNAPATAPVVTSKRQLALAKKLHDLDRARYRLQRTVNDNRIFRRNALPQAILAYLREMGDYSRRLAKKATSTSAPTPSTRISAEGYSVRYAKALVVSQHNRIIENLLGCGFLFDAIQNLGFIFHPSIPWNQPALQTVLHYFLIPFDLEALYWTCVAISVWFAINIFVLMYQIRSPTGISSHLVLAITRYQLGFLATVLFFPVAEHLFEPYYRIISAFVSYSAANNNATLPEHTVIDPYLIVQVATSTVCLILFLTPIFVTLSVLFSARENPSLSFCARNAPRVDFSEVIIRTFISLAFSIVPTWAATCVLLLGNLSILFMIIIYPPYSSLVSNIGKTIVTGSHVYGSLASAIVAWSNTSAPSTAIFWIIATMPFAGLLSAQLLRVRLLYLVPDNLDTLTALLKNKDTEDEVCDEVGCTKRLRQTLRAAVASYWTPLGLELATRILLIVTAKEREPSKNDSLESLSGTFESRGSKYLRRILREHSLRFFKFQGIELLGSDEAKVLAAHMLLMGIKRFPKSAWLMSRLSLLLTFETEALSGHFTMPTAHMAKDLVQQALLMEPTADTEFCLFFLFKKWYYDQATLSESEGVKDIIQAVQFRHDMSSAKHHEEKAVKNALMFWQQVQRQNYDLRMLMSILDNVETHEEAARGYYKRLTQAFPQSIKVLKAFSNFLRHVSFEPALAAKVESHAEFLEASQQRKRRMKHESIQSKSFNAQQSVASPASTVNSTFSLTESKADVDFDYLSHMFSIGQGSGNTNQAAARIINGLRISVYSSLVFLFMCSIAMFAVAFPIFVNTVVNQKVAFMESLGLRSLAQEAVYWARGLEWIQQYPAMFPHSISFTRSQLIEISSNISSSATAFLKDTSLSSAAIDAAWNTPNLGIVNYSPGLGFTGQVVNSNLREAIFLYSESLYNIATYNQTPVNVLPYWKFVIQNGPMTVFYGLLNVANAYQSEMQSDSNNKRFYLAIISAIACGAVPLLLCLFIFVPFFYKVSRDFRISSELFFRVPDSVIDHIIQKLKNKEISKKGRFSTAIVKRESKTAVNYQTRESLKAFEKQMPLRLKAVGISYVASLLTFAIITGISLYLLSLANSTLVQLAVEERYATIRSGYAWLLLSQSQELMRNDTNSLNYPSTVQLMKMVAEELFFINEGLQTGNASLGLSGFKGRIPALDDLEYNSKCLGPIEACGSLDYLLQFASTLAILITQEPPRVNGINTTLSPVYIQLQALMDSPDGILLSDLDQAATILSDNITPVIEFAYAFCNASFGISTVFFLFMTFYLMPKRMLFMIPPKALISIPEIADYLEAGRADKGDENAQELANLDLAEEQSEQKADDAESPEKERQGSNEAINAPSITPVARRAVFHDIGAIDAFSDSIEKQSDSADNRSGDLVPSRLRINESPSPARSGLSNP
ncbi:uncharacterized protein BJ171DRAFT_582196 [Polychytrium aggregatum]|uniref:uncharacterized protein n=1 Tax=Polychytrium aggregatum TaxID=110093 RepID=UPI0022FF26EF|nr:uncharacterized protein BJ171DRAFT_582196 [Polychytrium aggregatum]KAI9204218.1 hypothetical protein BJ171DRAFT_582196 [Polychytrium aggregatum]